jgi:uncharacterized NAD(P)/FAD-binding protein YdhS
MNSKYPGKQEKHMVASEKDQIVDIAFIGAGIATAYALLELMDELERSDFGRPLNVKIIDKYTDFFCGIPYGIRSGNSVLLINALDRFIPEPHRGDLVEWLDINKEGLLEEFLKEGGVKARSWVDNNLPNIKAKQWDSLYIPRFFFGKYISQKVSAAIEAHEKNGQLQMGFVQDEVLDIDQSNKHFEISTVSERRIAARNVILSIGSLPTRMIFGNASLQREENYMVLNDVYKEDLKTNLEAVREFLNGRRHLQTNLLVLGANASGLETLYKFTDEQEIGNRISSYTVLSSQGIMPDSDPDFDGLKNYHPEHLSKLSEEGQLTAKQIAQAAYRDLENARKMSLGAATTVDVISENVGTLLKRLDAVEAKIFACNFGNNIGRMQRCAGSHYTDSVKELIASNKLRHLAGRFSRLVAPKEIGHGLRLEYIDPTTSEKVVDAVIFNLVVNCMGATDLNSDDTPILLKNLIEKSFVIPNESGIGVDVDMDFQASEGFYVIGPLLAGNIIENKPLWHLEHCGRIIWSSGLMARKLVKNLNQGAL